MRVIDAATNIAGPYAASILADFGADVIKVEPLKGDPMRAYPPSVGEMTTQFAAVNHRKRYVALDLRADAGRAALRALLGTADVVIQNVRPGREARLGLDAASCHAANPRIVHATLSAFYPADGDRPGYDMLVQGEAGILHLTGEPDRPPSRIGASAIDHVSGLWLALGIMAALAEDRTERVVAVSMLDVAIGLLNEKVSAFAATGVEPRRMGAGTTATTPHGAFPTADAYIVIGAATDDSFRRLAEVVGPPLRGDGRFATQQGRLDHRGEVEGALSDALRRRPAAHWLPLLEEAGVPVGRVFTLAEAVERHRRDSPTGMLDVGGIDVLAPPVRVGAEWSSPAAPGAVGRDTDEVLRSAGLDPEALRAAGVAR
jgi:crotonobetainyl-CoA:carnitine CoA-transferase CaiB-like acyl-CoA transferase